VSPGIILELLELEDSAANRLGRKSFLLLTVCCLLLGGCGTRPADDGPSVEFSRIPLAVEGGTQNLDTIAGRVGGAHPGQRIVLFARSGAWYVQPFADQQFTNIQTDATWSSTTHLGTEYAALLVEPDYRPPAKTDALPAAGGGVAAIAVVKGRPVFWQTRWFRLSVGLACILTLLVLYQMRLRRLTNQLNLRFEERLAERMRIAQDLHDTLLQGVISASMQLHVAVDNLPVDSPARPPLDHVQQLMGRVMEEGRNAVRGLRSDGSDSLNLEQAFSRIRQEFAPQEPFEFRVIVEGRCRPLHPLIRDEVYRIGREALVNAFRHSRARSIEVEVEYVAARLRVLVRDDGGGITSQVLRSGREGHWGLSGMRERAERIGARFKVRSRAAAGTEVELTVPGHVAFQVESSARPTGWLAGLYTRNTIERRRRGAESEEDE
jgi:signal transduction histidine kinase